jgi:hypothetical protein
MTKNTKLSAQWEQHGWRLLEMLVLVLGVLAGSADAGQAPALLGDGDEPPETLDCLGDARGWISASPQTVALGQSTTLRWTVQWPAGCSGTVQINGVTRSGTSLAVTPTQPTTTYTLRVTRLGASRTLASTMVNAVLPKDASGRIVLVVNANDKTWAFVEAIKHKNAFVYVQNHVELDLSGEHTIYIGQGVSIIGGRTARERGPRLFTTSRPEVLFVLQDIDEDPEHTGGDNVRISGLRIDGGAMDVGEEEELGSTAIAIRGANNVEIDNNEIYGWRGTAVDVEDDQGRISRETNAMTIRIHDNFIHHNQHEGQEGYGVSVSHGAYALIEKNVFDYNRHAIMSGGQRDTGYFAYRNLVLKDGGYHDTYLTEPAWDSWYGWGYRHFTHQFDVHGQATCFPGHLNCGLAGQYYDIRYNTFFYTSGDAIKLRGTPTMGMDVVSNIFAHRYLWSWTWDAALNQSESGLRQVDNTVHVDTSGEHGRCDFDGDGIEDLFMATGRTWWYNSGGNRHWVYLNTSRKRLSELTLGYVDGDNRCDVTSDGVISSGGTGAPTAPRIDLLWQHTNGQLAVWLMDGGIVTGEGYPGLVGSSWQIKGTGDFSGDGYRDILWQEDTGQVAIWHMRGGVKLYETYPGGQIPASWSIQGAGDFDGDGFDDILWRDTTGQLAIWFKGEFPTEGIDEYPPKLPPVHPGYRGGEGPVDMTWNVKGVGDFNGDGRADILWRHNNGQVAIWHMAGGVNIGDIYPGGTDPYGVWRIDRVADFDGNGRSDILWRDTNGQLAIWFNGDIGAAAYPSYHNAGGPVHHSWQVAAAADFDGDGRADILWRHTNGQLGLWFMSGGRFLYDGYPRLVDTGWRIAGVLADRP